MFEKYRFDLPLIHERIQKCEYLVSRVTSTHNHAVLAVGYNDYGMPLVKQHDLLNDVIMSNSTLPAVLPSKCTEGIILPLGQEAGWHPAVRATLHFFGLFYFLLGAAVVTDYLMASSSVITSKIKKIYLSKPGGEGQEGDGQLEVIEVRVWHDNMINIALSAFNTSATEILLCTIEIIGNNFDHGELGPGTIVGSAAVNMLVVTAICMVSVPTNESRKIEGLRIYFVSMFFAMGGYGWILLTIRYITPGIITLWETILTLFMFPVFVILVWLSHHDYCDNFANKFIWRKKTGTEHHKSVDVKEKIDDELLKDGKLDRENLARLIQKLKRYSGLTDHDAATVAAFKLLHNHPHSTMWYRIGGIRALTGGYRNMPGLDARLRRAYRDIDLAEEFDGPLSLRSNIGSTNRSTLQSHKGSSLGSTGGATTMTAVSLHNPNASVVEFHSAIVAVERTVGSTDLAVCRHGNLDVPAKVRLTTIDGTARKNIHYLPIDRIVEFEPGRSEIHVPITILNAGQWEEDEEFFLRLSLIHNEHDQTELGRMYLMAVTIIDGNKQSIISFEKRGQLVKESAETVTAIVNRHEGATGSVSVRWRTVDKTAIAGKDYLAGSGELVFSKGEMSLYIEIPIVNHMTDQKDVHFEIELFAPSGGARLGRINRCTVTITNDEDLHSLIGTMASVTTVNLDAIKVRKTTWGQQMRDALLVDGGNVDKATRLDHIAHFLSFLWKALFSLIPPPTMLGGWPCLLVSLIALAFMTLLIDDTASTFGCLINLDDTVTGISIVALGTSMPEVFCARLETRMEKTADPAMIGTAARMAANVMLGLGLPWLVAVVYHEVQGTAFRVSDPDIGTNMATFMASALIAQFILVIRRLTPFLGKAELGGPTAWKWTSFAFLILLWLTYLTLAHYFMHGHIIPIEQRVPNGR